MRKSDKNEILEAINDFADIVQKQFIDLRTEFKTEITRMKAVLVTKDYLDDKLADVRGYSTVALKNEDDKVNKIANKLKEKRVFTEKDESDVISINPFPKLG